MTTVKIKNALNTQQKIIYTELSVEELQNYLNNGTDNILIIKFSAEWCGPCKKIKELVHSSFLDMPDNVLCFDIDVDESIDLFAQLKVKKMVKTLPALLVYYCNKKRDYWYIADNNISSSDKMVVFNFFQEIYSNAKY